MSRETVNERTVEELGENQRTRLQYAAATGVVGGFVGYILLGVAYATGAIALKPVLLLLGGMVIYDFLSKLALDDDDTVSPIVLDLDGDGVEADAFTHFDHAGDGWNEFSRWANEDDGVLVWDRNKDGVINDGSELFGNNTALNSGDKAANGFAALAELDSNADGVVDASDEEWASLRVMRWTDANDDGIMQESESRLVMLSSLGIKSLGTTYSESDHIDKSGNAHRQVGSYTKTDGSTAKMTDVWFVTDFGKTTYDDSGIPQHSKAIKVLPDLLGSGRVYNLRDAMALDDAKDTDESSRLKTPYYEGKRMEKRSLRQMVEAFVEVDEEGAPVLDREFARYNNDKPNISMTYLCPTPASADCAPQTKFPILTFYQQGGQNQTLLCRRCAEPMQALCVNVSGFGC